MENEKSARSVDAAGKQRATITASYVEEDVTRAGVVQGWIQRVNDSSRATKLDGGASPRAALSALGRAQIWNGRGITGRKSRDNRDVTSHRDSTMWHL